MNIIASGVALGFQIDGAKFFFSPQIRENSSDPNWLGGIQKLRWQDEVGRWFFKCQLYLISLFSKHVNLR